MQKVFRSRAEVSAKLSVHDGDAITAADLAITHRTQGRAVDLHIGEVPQQVKKIPLCFEQNGPAAENLLNYKCVLLSQKLIVARRNELRHFVHRRSGRVVWSESEVRQERCARAVEDNR